MLVAVTSCALVEALFYNGHRKELMQEPYLSYLPLPQVPRLEKSSLHLKKKKGKQHELSICALI